MVQPPAHMPEPWMVTRDGETRRIEHIDPLSAEPFPWDEEWQDKMPRWLFPTVFWGLVIFVLIGLVIWLLTLL
jgi:hypothetical protein